MSWRRHSTNLSGLDLSDDLLKLLHLPLALLTVDPDALYTEHKLKRKNQRLRMKSAILCLLALSLLPSMSQAQVPVFQVDHATSTVKFNVSASVPISGTFDKWDATLTFTSPELATGVIGYQHSSRHREYGKRSEGLRFLLALLVSLAWATVQFSAQDPRAFES